MFDVEPDSEKIVTIKSKLIAPDRVRFSWHWNLERHASAPLRCYRSLRPFHSVTLDEIIAKDELIIDSSDFKGHAEDVRVGKNQVQYYNFIVFGASRNNFAGGIMKSLEEYSYRAEERRKLMLKMQILGQVSGHKRWDEIEPGDTIFKMSDQEDTEDDEEDEDEEKSEGSGGGALLLGGLVALGAVALGLKTLSSVKKEDVDKGLEWLKNKDRFIVKRCEVAFGGTVPQRSSESFIEQVKLEVEEDRLVKNELDKLVRSGDLTTEERDAKWQQYKRSKRRDPNVGGY